MFPQMIIRFLDSLLILTGVVLIIVGFSGVIRSETHRGWAAIMLAGGVAMIAVGAFVWRHKRGAGNRTKPVS
jgi:uncharacterized membrane protein SirB2